ncbi:hypothetical protein M569_02959, partial [Genlisea aurea]
LCCLAMFLLSLFFIASVVLLLVPTTTLIRHTLKTRLRRWYAEDSFYVHQSYRIPKYNDAMQENLLFRKAYSYLNSLPSVEDSDFAKLYSSFTPWDIITLVVDENQTTVVDTFLGSRIRRNDRRRILVPYLQHIHQVYDEMEQKRNSVRLLFINATTGTNGRWRSTPFTHPATMETIVMDPDLKNRIKADLENFVKSRQYYHRLGRVWKRNYLLYGASGTGKSTFIAAMAKFLGYDIYEIDPRELLRGDSDLKQLLLQTTNKSLIVIEDLDRYLAEKSAAAAGILNFMDGLLSGCGEERMVVLTMNSKEKMDVSLLRPGRIDVHIHFPLCDFTAFKALAISHLGLKDHKLFPRLEGMFQKGTTLSQAELCEIMISNRTSPSRALKTVITALQMEDYSASTRAETKLKNHRAEEDCVDNGMAIHPHPIKEIRSLYGLLRARSRKASVDRLELETEEN